MGRRFFLYVSVDLAPSQEERRTSVGTQTAFPSMSETPTPIPRRDHVPLRSRAEQIADELARQELADQPTTRQLPTAPLPVAPRPPGR